MSDLNSKYSRSVYNLGASDGIWVGLAMGLCMMCMIESAKIPFLAFLGLLLFVAVPVMVWKMLRRAWMLSRVPPSFSAVWLHGICIFLFGGLIMALITYISLRYLSPGWIETQTLEAASRLAGNPDTAEQSLILLRIVESGQLPTPIYTAISSIWMVAFTGSLMSMIFAYFLTRTVRFRTLRDQNLKKEFNER